MNRKQKALEKATMAYMDCACNRQSLLSPPSDDMTAEALLKMDRQSAKNIISAYLAELDSDGGGV